jgi:hypothetical protein
MNYKYVSLEIAYGKNVEPLIILMKMIFLFAIELYN